MQYNCATQQLNLHLDLNSKALEGMGTDQSKVLSFGSETKYKAIETSKNPWS